MVYSVQDESRAPMMVQNQNPEAGMVHAKPQRAYMKLGGAFMMIDDHRPEMEPPAWPWPTAASQQEDQGTSESAHGIDMPGFDGEAHRKFMRNLG